MVYDILDCVKKCKKNPKKQTPLDSLPCLTITRDSPLAVNTFHAQSKQSVYALMPMLTIALPKKIVLNISYLCLKSMGENRSIEILTSLGLCTDHRQAHRHCKEQNK